MVLKVKVRCDCEDHYLELFQTFEGDSPVYKRYCYKCGRWWTTKVCVPTTSTEVVYDCFGKPITQIYRGNTEMCLSRTTAIPGAIIFDDGLGEVYTYQMHADGTVGGLIRMVKY